MTARWYYRDPDGDYVEIIGRIALEGWELREQAEEGSAGTATIVIDDPEMDFDIVGRVPLYVIEDSSEADDDILFSGRVTMQEVGREGGEWAQPLARVWSVALTDVNSLWQKRVMVGTDCNRPAETDVERVQWLVATSEMNWITDASTYISTATPVDLDACDYRGQFSSQIMDDCAQASGKNWFAWQLRDGNGDQQTAAWYGRDSLAVYDSPLFLSNDPDDWDDATLADGTSLVWPISADTKLARDPSRVYSGVYLTYSGGAVYRQDAGTGATFTNWDFVAPSSNIKSKTKAIARAIRYLDELDEQDLVITTSVELPAAKATMIRAGMRVPFKATHLPELSAFYYWCRVLSCAITPVAAGDRYRLTLELAPTGGHIYFSAACAALSIPTTEAGTYEGNHSNITQSPGNLFYLRPGLVYPLVPEIGFAGQWYFPVYVDDAAGDATQNIVRIIVAGSGTLTITVAEYAGGPHTFNWVLSYVSGGNPFSEDSGGGLGVGSHDFTIPDDEHCYHYIDFGDDTLARGGKWQFVSWQWAPG